jgi:hypothetical protein
MTMTTTLLWTVIAGSTIEQSLTDVNTRSLVRHYTQHQISNTDWHWHIHFLHQCSDTTEAHCRHRRHFNWIQQTHCKHRRRTADTTDSLQTHWVDHYIFSNTPPQIVNLFQTSELIGHQEHHQGKLQNWLVTFTIEPTSLFLPLHNSCLHKNGQSS